MKDFKNLENFLAERDPFCMQNENDSYFYLVMDNNLDIPFYQMIPSNLDLGFDMIGSFLVFVDLRGTEKNFEEFLNALTIRVRNTNPNMLARVTLVCFLNAKNEAQERKLKQTANTEQFKNTLFKYSFQKELIRV